MIETKDELRLANSMLTEHIVNLQEVIDNLESNNRDLLAVIAEKDRLITQCIEDNLGLADGDNCTLKLVKDALAISTEDIDISIGWIGKLLAANQVMREALDELSDHAPWGGDIYAYQRWINLVASKALAINIGDVYLHEFTGATGIYTQGKVVNVPYKIYTIKTKSNTE